jgi:hypothetical protein
MSQPTAYVKATNFAQDESGNVGGRSTVRTDRVDAELANIETTLGETLDNLALIQRDDGQLTDALVEYWNLSSACKAAVLATKWTARGLWATATAYVVNDMVDVPARATSAPSRTRAVFSQPITRPAAGNFS